MFYFLSKFLDFLLNPNAIIFLLLLGVLVFRKKHTWRKRFFIAALVTLFCFSNDFLINLLMRWWEYKPVPVTEIQQKHYSVGIVLTGFTNTEMEESDHVYFAEAAGRLNQAIWLYQQGIIDRILITGGGTRLTGAYLNEGGRITQYLKDIGIPSKDILLDSLARNTHENATYTAQMLKQKQINGPYLLITSSFHMRRSVACFAKVGLHPDIFPTAFLQHRNKWTPDSWLIPSADAQYHLKTLWKEWLGFIAYKMMGYC